MPQIHESTLIKDVQVVTLHPFIDERGRFMEVFRKEWFPQRSWEIIQSNRSDSEAGLADIRPDSPTFGATQVIEMGGQNQLGVSIPVGVAHGFVTLNDATLTCVVDNYYDGADEHGIAWNDPELALPWGVDALTVSSRDAANPFLKETAIEKLPK